MSKIDYVTILEGSFDAGMLVDAVNGVIIYANEGCQQLLGLESTTPWMCPLDSKLTWWNSQTGGDVLEFSSSIVPRLQRQLEQDCWNVTGHWWDHDRYDEAPDDEKERRMFPAVAKPTLVQDRNDPGHFFAVIFLRHESTQRVINEQLQQPPNQMEPNNDQSETTISTTATRRHKLFNHKNNNSIRSNTAFFEKDEEPYLTVDRRGMILSVSSSAVEQIDWCQPELVGKSIRPTSEPDQPKPILTLNPDGTITSINELAASEYTWLSPKLIGKSIHTTTAAAQDESNGTLDLVDESDATRTSMEGTTSHTAPSGTGTDLSFEAERQELMMDLWETPAKWKQVEQEIQREEWEKEKQRQLEKRREEASKRRRRQSSWFVKAWRSNSVISKLRSDSTDSFSHLSVAEENNASSSDVVLQVCIVERDGETIASATADAHLRESVMMAIVEASPDPLLQIKSSGVIQIVNKAACSVFGYSREELVGQNIAMVCGDGHGEHFGRLLQRYLATDNTRVIAQKQELRGRKKNGIEFPIELAVVEVDTFLGEDRLFCSFIRDLTAAEAPRQLHQSIIEGSPDPIILANEKGMIQMVNQAAVEVFGYPRKKLLRSNVSIILGDEHPFSDDLDLQTNVKTENKSGVNQWQELMARRAHSKRGGVSEFPIELAVVEIPVIDQEQKRMFCGFVRDVSQINEQQSQLHEREQLLTGMLNSSIDPLFQINSKGVIEFINWAACQLFQYTESELLGKNVSTILGEEHRANQDRFLKRYLNTGTFHDMDKVEELLVKKRDGAEFIIELTLIEIETGLNAKNRIFCGLVRDLSERKQQEQTILEKLLSGVMKVLRDPMFQFNDSGIIHNVNDAACELLGFTVDDFLGKNISLFVEHKSSEHTPRFLQDLLRTQKVGSADTLQQSVSARLKSGEELQLELTLVEIHNCGGVERQFLGCLQTIARQNQGTSTDRVQEGGVINSILDKMLDALFVTNGRGEVLRVNSAAVKIFGGSKDGLCRNSLFHVLCREDAEQLELDMKKFSLHNAEIPRTRQVQAIRLDDSSFQALLVVSVLNQHDGHLCLFFRDLSDSLVGEPHQENYVVAGNGSNGTAAAPSRGRKLDPPSRESMLGRTTDEMVEFEDEGSQSSHPDGLVDVVYMDNHFVKHPSEHSYSYKRDTDDDESREDDSLSSSEDSDDDSMSFRYSRSGLSFG